MFIKPFGCMTSHVKIIQLYKGRPCNFFNDLCIYFRERVHVHECGEEQREREGRQTPC